MSDHVRISNIAFFWCGLDRRVDRVDRVDRVLFVELCFLLTSWRLAKLMRTHHVDFEIHIGG